ncbi:hypothetical protein B0F90DRAFT_1253932 [Multifurca ochricompacta]|uniref:Uncharacterized protein n=1 Tax=Multifurca ochricompacta TaxID=376703 RepID=A0AAD4QMP4_9AGAM|nr:hypothetical protein B0F90DRAFT_1253932 [Multifurca ochricompacta]
MVQNCSTRPGRSLTVTCERLTKILMYSTKDWHISENRHPEPVLLTHSASSPGPCHVTRPPDHPPEHPSPSKRQRLASTPSSSSLPSTPARDRNNVDFYQARFESTMRLKDAWTQLAQRYARPLDEDDIIDLREEKILKDRGVVRSINAQINFGDVSLPDELGNDASSEGGAAHSEDEDDFDEIDTLSHGTRLQNRLEAKLRRVKPLHDLELEDEDEDDLREFLEAEKRTREEFGPVDEDFGEDLTRLQEATEGGDLGDETIEISSSSDEEDGVNQDLSRTLTRSTNANCDSEDEDELGGWEHDESNAIYEVVRTPARDEHEVIEIFDTPPTSPPSHHY